MLNAVYLSFSCELCLVASHNNESNSVARSSDSKLETSVETYLLNLVLSKKKKDSVVLAGHCENGNDVSGCIGYIEFLA
jgi:hypothetical protein